MLIHADFKHFVQEMITQILLSVACIIESELPDSLFWSRNPKNVSTFMYKPVPAL